MKRFLLLGIAVLALMGCRRQPTAQDLLLSAADTMTETESLRFTIERQGDAAAITLGDVTAGVLGASGAYEAPDKIYATVQAQVSGFVSEAEVLWLPEGIYYRHPLLAPNFTQVEFEGFDALEMFSPERGIPKVLQTLQQATLGEVEDIDGVAARHITALADSEDLAGLTGSALSTGPATVDVWVTEESRQIVRIGVTEANGSGWVIDFYGFDEPVEIPSPD